MLKAGTGLALFWNGELESAEALLSAPAYQLVLRGYGTPAGPPDDYRPPRLTARVICQDGADVAEQSLQLAATSATVFGPVVRLPAGGAACRVRLIFNDDLSSRSGDRLDNRNAIIQTMLWAPVAYDFAEQLDQARIEAPTEPFPHVEKTTFTIADETRPVLMLHPPASLAYPVQIPRWATLLVTSVVLDPATWEWGGDGAVLSVDVVGSDGRQRVWEQHVGVSPAERRWQEVAIDMRPFRGQTVEIVFGVDSGPAGDFTGDRTGWVNPVLF